MVVPGRIETSSAGGVTTVPPVTQAQVDVGPSSTSPSVLT